MSRSPLSRRDFLRLAGLSPALAPFLGNLPAFASVAEPPLAKQRLVIVFSPNGVVPTNFWPDPTEVSGALALPPILEPFEPFRKQLITLHGLGDKVRGDGDNHMRGIGCLLTGIELFPGNLQGGSHTPAGWSSGQSIDQAIGAHLQADAATRTRFGTLEFGVVVPDRADTWTRMVYAGPNKPIAPIDDPYQMFAKLYGDRRNRKALASVLDTIHEDFARVASLVGEEDRRLLDEHATFVRSMERQLAADAQAKRLGHAAPELEPGVRDANEDMPRISRMQIELLTHALEADFTRVATLQFTNSVGNARMSWLGIEESHHELSHKPDDDQAAQESLTKINRWYAGEIAHLAQRLADTPEPGGDGSLLDNTLIVWTNELGKGNSHSLDNIPFVLIGGAGGQTWGLRGERALSLGGTPHNRLLMWLAHAFGKEVPSFGRPDFCDAGPLTGLN
ncbi:hypothetical protein Pla108_20840 [Botrimarina colliarenosi]|uniref:DUF1552 domain-containing protein n=1 Tax=Botrimarina colliarenosi TaxID=2528001 RepID=A0A5C6AES7_9BACT|nr:DUF1552 domain-containing protein [Botrimarina colliarenosi]TWT97930.1 hypothetical protein Pla108_20840 [Botrimarina colliarenosi]